MYEMTSIAPVAGVGSVDGVNGLSVDDQIEDQRCVLNGITNGDDGIDKVAISGFPSDE